MMSEESWRDMDPTPNGFVGYYFHVWLLDTSGETARKKIERQGKVLSVHGDHFMCQLFSWIDGYPTNCVIYSLEDMKEFSFYATSEEFIEAEKKARVWDRR